MREPGRRGPALGAGEGQKPWPVGVRLATAEEVQGVSSTTTA